jgi:precorrin-3B synthase
MSGRTEGGATEQYRPREPLFSPLGVFNLVHTKALGVALPFGHVSASQLIALCRAAESLAATEIRFAPLRALLLLGLSEAGCATLQDAAASLGFIIDPADPRKSVAACPGAPACGSGHIAARTIAEEIARNSADILDASVSIHVSGCAKGCASQANATITLVGGEKGAGLVVSGTAKDLPIAYTPGMELTQGFGRIAALVRERRRPGEDMAACLARLGPGRVATAFQPEQAAGRVQPTKRKMAHKNKELEWEDDSISSLPVSG